MANLNRVFLMGNLTRDPEMRYIPSGTAVSNFTLAVNRVYRLPSGERKEEVSFIRVVTWGRIAETCSEFLKKGNPVFVEGRLQSRTWDTPDGQKRSTLEVVAQNVQFLRPAGKPMMAGFEEASSPPSSIQKEPLEEISLDLPGEEPHSSASEPPGEGQVPF